jgi:hypothetical protein
MEQKVKRDKIPVTDSIEELARFWDTHDVTDYEDQWEEVTEPLFEGRPGRALVIHLEPPEAREIDRIARERGVKQTDLLREWVLEKLREGLD